MTSAVIVCDNLVKIYKVADLEVVALQGLDLEVQPGEMLALVGVSGSGKTTLLNILGGLDSPSAGRCLVAGYDLARLNERQRLFYRRFVVGHVWQQSGRNLLPELSLQENIELPQLLSGVGRRERLRRARELLHLIGLEAAAQRLPAQISGGEQQRVAIAVALANRPQVLLADEPTGELDTQTAGEILQLLRRLNQELGLTIVLVTHDPALAANVDRVIAIRDGRTSTETVRREAPLASVPPHLTTASAVIALPSETHRESVLIDRVGRLQLPKEALERIPFHGRAEVVIASDHVELWPVGSLLNGKPAVGSNGSESREEQL
ncbi:ABC transporter ATP-binding protein [Thermogemmatispora aurantia]|jgi:ABC-type lipoprotein export system ATPase subunit|uniref:ABC transporter ATP-binding protein n=1 Tax=Thermogemmatispora aurantia TaxID=2045279 RepID=A0A5J4K9S2_9CHLR|nr:ABC transporter ATP-binding protein [Thermogemmatispora aurantia]GER85308.1 ABC transporter ATP-binding protein [Thermogemmatispora aurantia]